MDICVEKKFLEPGFQFSGQYIILGVLKISTDLSPSPSLYESPYTLWGQNGAMAEWWLIVETPASSPYESVYY